MKRVLIGSMFLLMCIGISSAQTETLSRKDSLKYEKEFLYHAVYEGLSTDQVGAEIVTNILANESFLFVGKCPICSEVIKALNTYLATNPEDGKLVDHQKLFITLTDPEDPNEKESIEEAKVALKVLIDDYVRLGFDNFPLSAEQKEKIKAKLEKDRKTGMSRKSEAFGNYCPSCDGACRIK